MLSAHFYFWNSGTDMQMTVEGLLQTLLYEFCSIFPLPSATPFRNVGRSSDSSAKMTIPGSGRSSVRHYGNWCSTSAADRTSS